MLGNPASPLAMWSEGTQKPLGLSTPPDGTTRAPFSPLIWPPNKLSNFLSDTEKIKCDDNVGGAAFPTWSGKALLRRCCFSCKGHHAKVRRERVLGRKQGAGP